MFDTTKTRHTALAALAVAGLALGGTAAFADAGHGDGDTDDNHGAGVTRLLMPIMSSSRGMQTFVDKGCYTCHAVNGVGGHDASSLDAHDMDPYMNPFDMSAKMWRMAAIMIPAQEEVFGEQIDFTGDELADIIAFLHDDDQQHQFTEAMLSPAQMRAMEHEHGGGPAVEMHSEEIGH